MPRNTEYTQNNLDGTKASDVDVDREKKVVEYLDKWDLEVSGDLSISPQLLGGSLSNNFHVTFVLDAEKPYLFIEDFSNWDHRGLDNPLNVRIGIKAKAPSGRIFYTNIKDDNYVDSPDLNCEDVNYTRVNNNKIYLPLLDSGNPERGQYKIELHERKLVDGASWTSANSASAQRKVHTIVYDYQYIAPVVTGKYDVDVAVPVLRSLETTDYDIGHKGLKTSFNITSCIQWNTDEYAIGIKSHASQPLGGVFPVDEEVILHGNSNGNGVYRVKEVLGYGDADNIEGLTNADNTAFYFVVEGLDEQIDQYGTVSTKEHRLNYPIELGLAPVTSYGDSYVTNDFYTELHTSQISNRVIWKMTDNVSIVDAVTGSFSYNVVANSDLCDVYCCLEDIYNRWQAHKLGDAVLAKKFKEQLYEALVYLPLLNHAIDCNEGDRISELREKIIDVADCDPACYCDDKKPRKVYAVLMRDEQEVVEGDNGVGVIRSINSGVITYSVGIDKALYDKINKKYQALLAKSGSNLSIVDGGVPGDPLTGTRDYTVSYTPATVEVPNEISFRTLFGTSLPKRDGEKGYFDFNKVARYNVTRYTSASGDLFDYMNTINITSSLDYSYGPRGEYNWAKSMVEFAVSNFGISDGKYSVICSLDIGCIPNSSQYTKCFRLDEFIENEEKVDKLQDQIEALQSDKVKAEKVAAKAKAYREAELQAELEAYDAEIVRLQEQINVLNDMKISRQEEIESLNKRIDDINQELSNSNTTIERQAELETALLQLKAQKGVYEDELQEIDKLRAESLTLEADIERAQAEKTSSQAEILNQLAVTKEEQAIVEGQYKAAEDLVAKADDLQAQVESTNSEIGARAATIEAERAEEEAELTALRGELAAAETSIAEKSEELYYINSDLQDAQDKLDALKKRRDAAQLDTGQDYGNEEVEEIEKLIEAIKVKQRYVSLIEKYSYHPFIFDKQNDSFKIRLINLFERDKMSMNVLGVELIGVELFLNVLITKLD